MPASSGLKILPAIPGPDHIPPEGEAFSVIEGLLIKSVPGRSIVISGIGSYKSAVGIPAICICNTVPDKMIAYTSDEWIECISHNSRT